MEVLFDVLRARGIYGAAAWRASIHFVRRTEEAVEEEGKENAARGRESLRREEV